MNPSCYRKSGNGNPPPTAGRALLLSQQQNEPIPLVNVDESKLEKPAPPTDFTRKIPGFAMDMHTPAGKQYGLGKKDFYENSAVLANKALDDPYEERAKAGDLELEKQQGKGKRW